MRSHAEESVNSYHDAFNQSSTSQCVFVINHTMDLRSRNLKSCSLGTQSIIKPCHNFFLEHHIPYEDNKSHQSQARPQLIIVFQSAEALGEPSRYLRDRVPKTDLDP